MLVFKPRISGTSMSRVPPSSLVFLLFLVVAFVFPGTAGSRTAANDTATLNVVYNANGTISVSLADGTSVGAPSAPGTVIPPGKYSIVFNNRAEVVHMFHLSGPGVKLVTDLRPIGEDAMCAGITGLYTLQTYEETFLPNSTYVFQDDYQPSSTHAVFSTSSSATAVPTSSGAKTGSGSGQILTGSSSFTGLVSNGPDRGVLTASVSLNGLLSLTYKGKHVVKLIPGRYTITIADRSPKDGFVMQNGSRPAVIVAGAGFVGKRSSTIELTAGRWSYFPTGSGKRTAFVVGH
jgi:hypothetical protein